MHQKGAEVSAAILRVDGDTGALTGEWRDGRVRGVHAGFAGRASGEFYTQTKREVTSLVEGLLAESTSAAAR